MQKNKIMAIGLIVIVIMGIAYGSLLNRVKNLETQINQGNLTQAQINNLYTRINEMPPISIYGDRQKITALEYEVSRLKDLVLEANEITFVYGKITDIIVGENLQLKVETKEGINIIDKSEKSRVYFYSEIGLVESNFQSLIEKFEGEKKTGFLDEYTFVVIDSKLIHIYQGI